MASSDDEMDLSADEDEDEDEDDRPFRLARPYRIRRTTRCDLGVVLHGTSRHGLGGLDYQPGVGRTAAAMARGATVGQWALQKAMIRSSKHKPKKAHALWKDLDSDITSSWGTRVPIMAAIWFGAQMDLFSEDRSEQLPAALYALWVCTRASGPFSWKNRPPDYRPVISFDPGSFSMLLVRRLLSLSARATAG